MRKLLLVAVLLVGCRDGNVAFTDKCGLSCYTDTDTRPGTGPCQAGHWECGDDGGMTCVGEVLPAPETCDRVDNNCNGAIDEGVSNCCRPTGAEVCDGKDNDCNGIIDDIQSPPEFCYDGPPDTASFGECHPGVKRCISGKTVCFGQVLPAPERCNQRDDDCDGQPDQGLSSTSDIDLVFVIDNSGSMDTKLAAVSFAVTSFSNRFQSKSNIRWGLVTAPDQDYMKYGSHPRLYKDLGSANDFALAVASQPGTEGSGEEPTLDAILALCNPANSLGLSWKPGARKVIVVFSDEVPQSYATPSTSVSEVIAVCGGLKTPVYVFTEMYSVGQFWQPICTGTVAVCYDLTSPSVGKDLDNLVTSVTCQ